MLLDVVSLRADEVAEVGHLDHDGLISRTSELTTFTVVVHIA